MRFIVVNFKRTVCWRKSFDGETNKLCDIFLYRFWNESFIQHEFSLTMERTFEKSLCLGTGIPFAALIFMISIPNAMILVTLYRNPLRCFRKTFTVFLAFITATDLFVGSVVCTGEAITRFLCSFRGKQFPGEGDIPTILGYIGINSSILMVTAMSVDRLVSVVCPHFYLNTVKPKTLVLCNSIIVIFLRFFPASNLLGFQLMCIFP